MTLRSRSNETERAALSQTITKYQLVEFRSGDILFCSDSMLSIIMHRVITIFAVAQTALKYWLRFSPFCDWPIDADLHDLLICLSHARY